MTHLHGGQTPYQSDGSPDAWFTPNDRQVGRLFNFIYKYPNKQKSSTLWYHDHALGITRLNVYAGLAGFYLVRDCQERKLPKYPYEIPIVIQDRDFKSDGSLWYPPTIQPEFFGNFIVVNGKIWPRASVEPREYRIRLLNGSDSRFYTLSLDNGPNFKVIGSDQGFLKRPVDVKTLTIGPGERYDLLIDFGNYQNQNIILINTAPTPYPGGDLPDPETTGRILRFDVSQRKCEYKISKIPRIHLKYPKRIDKIRSLILMESVDSGSIKPLLGTTELGGLEWDEPVTETPKYRTNEIWEIYNTTMDTHPIHLHGVKFLLLNKQNFTADQDPETGALTNIQLIGPSEPPAEINLGWKDTILMSPGQVTRISIPFKLKGEYVWHCHILSHEDNEMMRPLLVKH